MNNEVIEKAFGSLIEKSKKGVKKVGNPMYRKVINEKGNTVYVLVNKNNSVEFKKQPKKLTNEEFKKKKTLGAVGLYQEPIPTYEEIGEDLLKLDFLSDDSRESLKRIFQRMKFFNSSIRVAKEMGNTEMLKGHSRGLQTLINTANNVVEAAKRGQSAREFELSMFNDIKNKFELNGYKLEINGVDQDSIDYIMNEHPNFNFVELCKDTFQTFEKQKNLISKEGIDVTKWKPKFEINFKSNGFEVIGKHNSTGSTTKDKYGFSVDLKFKMIRRFGGHGDGKYVNHSLFKCGQETTDTHAINVMRGGFAKGMMSGLSKQYENSGISDITVSAASQYGTPFTGSNTWGRWGFRANGKSIVTAAKRYFKTPTMLPTDEKVIVHENRDDIYIVKQQPKGVFVKIPIKTGEYEENGRKFEVEVLTKKDDESGMFKSKIIKQTEILPSDIEKLEIVYEKTKGDSDDSANFRLKNFYDAFTGEDEADVLRGILYGIGWVGKINLKNKEEKEDFMENINKKYEKVPNSVYEYFNSTDKTVLEKKPKTALITT